VRRAPRELIAVDQVEKVTRRAHCLRADVMAITN
jgi:hypothetical protein